MTSYILAGGCFWCLDAVYRRVKGVSQVVCGYTGGVIANPTYEQVSTGTTGHAEAVEITFDESVITGETILDIFFLIHNPTTKNRQGNDIGTQYRSAMFFQNNQQEALFKSSVEKASKHWDVPIVTEIKQLNEFYPAESYHQNYFTNNPDNGYCSFVINPKLNKVRLSLSEWFNKEDE